MLSLQDVLRGRQREEFVGREEQLTLFHRNLKYAVDDRRRYFVINVSGQGGVGKTWLLRRFEKIAGECGAVTACTGEVEEDVPAVMNRLAEQFAAQGYSLDDFAGRYKVYQQRQQEIEADPDAPPGLFASLGRAVVKGGLEFGPSLVPGPGGFVLGKVVERVVDKEAVADWGGQVTSYLARKIGNKDEVRLVQQPVEVLTPLFLAGLREVAEEHPLALFFDTYERTGRFLDAWLRALLEGRHGEVPANVVLVVAGRHELDRNDWATYEGLLARLPLDPFTEEEARAYLGCKGVDDERVVEVILALSGRLPLLVVTLAAESPDDPARVGDPSGTAVERFLWWVADDRQRQVALDAALPRRFDRDVVAVLVGEEEKEEEGKLFAWLKDMPFVEERREAGWVYHEVVRAQMLRCKRRESPRGWAGLHGRLVEYYEGLRDGLGLDEAAGRRDEDWQGYALEGLYHRLCRSPRGEVTAALNGLVAAWEARQSFARRWAGVVGQAGEDAGSEVVAGWGRRLREGVEAFAGERYEEAVEMFSALLKEGGLEVRWRAAAFDWRGYLYYLADQYTVAVKDLTEAIQLAPEEAEYWADRGMTYLQMERYEEALADLERAMDLDPDDALHIASRGMTYLQMGRNEEALADFDQAVELKPDYAWAVASRGRTYRLMGRYEEALADFERAMELDPDDASYIANRGETYRRMGRYEEALADFERAMELDPDDASYIADRGETYRQMGRYEEALADFERAMEFDPDEASYIAVRGETYRLMGRNEEALADFERAIAFKPDYAWAIVHRGVTYQQMGRYEEALVDLERAIALDPDYAWAIASRGVTYRQIERYEEALVDFDRAIELKPDEALYIYSRGEAYRQMGRYEEALADFERAMELKPDYVWVFADRGRTYQQMGRYEEAMVDFDRVIALKPDYDWAIASRGEIYWLMGRYEEALTDFDRAIELDPDEAWYIAVRGMTYRRMGRYEEARQDCERARALDADDPYTHECFGDLYLGLELYEEAVRCYRESVAGERSARRYFGLGRALLALGREDEAREVYVAGRGMASEVEVEEALEALGELRGLVVSYFADAQG